MNSTSEQLRVVLNGCRKEDRASQKALYDHFYTYSFGISMRYAHNEDDAIEVVQDGFLKVFRHLNDFASPNDGDSLYAAFRGWVKKIMVFTAIDHYRSRKKHMGVEDIESQNYKLISGGHSPLDKMAYEELIKMVQKLSPAYRAAFNLFVIDGFTHEEISAIMGISIGTSKSNLAKARDNLRTMLKKPEEVFYPKYE